MLSSTTARRAATAALAVSLTLLTAACGDDAAPKASPAAPPAASGPVAPAAPPAPSGAATPPSSPRVPDGTPPASPPGAAPAGGGLPTPGPEKVRDAFAGLQATLGDSCTPGNCAYFLGRVHDELHRMDRAMKADPKGPGHFPEPIAAVAKLDGELGGNSAFENLKKHQSILISTRDEINSWMQDHPDDYR
ncbi:hypothetical protein ACFWBI_10735 [Streptomyces sp. NPDC059982]|uniref:hypothetical protein n=1 Tax=Streptomyces sp. NPDC059982 TaxID=3347024 RepID=UPI0036CCA190